MTISKSLLRKFKNLQSSPAITAQRCGLVEKFIPPERSVLSMDIWKFVKSLQKVLDLGRHFGYWEKISLTVSLGLHVVK